MMYDAKSQVAKKLASIPSVNVSSNHKEGLKSIPCILYKEIDNKPTEPTMTLQEVVYSIDIYNTTSTSKLANEVDNKLLELGLRRITCIDLDDPSGYRHKHMKFRGIINTKTELVYQ